KELEYLPLAAKAPGATIFEKGGIDGPNAYAKASMTREEADSWCGNWEPSQTRSECIAQALKEIGGRKYAAQDDRLKKTTDAVDGEHYEMAGRWEGGIGHGRTKWKRASTGEIVGRSNAEGGLGIALQWETLCPHGGLQPVDSSKMVLDPDDYS